MSSFSEARAALLRAIRAVFPDAKPARRWAGVETWAAPRPAAIVDHDAPGTYDPAVTVIGIADRKSGPTIYFLDPGDYFVLDKHRALLEGAGLKLGRGCIMHTRKAPLPTSPLEELFRRVKARDAASAAKAPRAEPGPRKAARRTGPAASVEEYLAALPATQRKTLERLRKLIRDAAPDATERIGYGMPTYAYAGRNLVHFAAFKDHCSFFPGSGAVTERFARELEAFETAKGTVRFAPEHPLPAALVKRIVKMRVAENEARAAKRAPRKGAATKRAAKGASAKRAKAATRRR